MANIIDIFNGAKIDNSKLTGSDGVFQSEEHIREKSISQQRYISSVDYTTASNFARFGLAEEYYKNAFNYIIDNYPLDGDSASKLKFENELSDFEYYYFNNTYPKAVGHIKLSGSQYVHISRSLPELSLSAKNAYNSFTGSTNNTTLNISGADGITFETWAKFEGLTTSTGSLLSASNGVDSLRIQVITGSSNNDFQVLTGSDLLASYSLESWRLSNWTRYGATINGSEIKLYVNGNLVKKTTSTQLFTGSCEFKIQPVNCTSSIDDVRLWNSVRTEEKIGKFWFTTVDGNDISDNSLVFYLKFNEGIDSTSAYAVNCFDSSGRRNDGVISGYQSNCRIPTSAFDISGLLEEPEVKDPIIIKALTESTTVASLYASAISGAIEHDYQNANALYKKFPSWLLEEEESLQTKNLKQLIQIVAYYFDDLYNKVTEVANYKKINYQSDPDKIYSFYDKILASTGFNFIDLFSGIDPEQKLASRNDTVIFDNDIEKIKNKIYQNIYNNLSYILKGKGTEKSIKNFLRAYGVNENLVRINTYADNGIYELQDSSRPAISNKKSVDLSEYNYSSSIYNSSSLPTESVSSSYTFESLVMLPYANAEALAGQEISLLGVHGYVGSAWDTTGLDARVYLKKDSTNKNRVRFYLSSSLANTVVSSSEIEGVYDNRLYNISVRVINNIQDSSTNLANPTYTLKVDGYTYDSDILSQKCFNLSSSLNYDTGSKAFDVEKRFYVGAHLTNFSGTLLQNTDIKVLSANFWNLDVGDQTLKFHAKDIENYGIYDPQNVIDITSTTLTPRSDGLVFRYDFENPINASSNQITTIYDVVGDYKGLGKNFTDGSSFLTKEKLLTNKQRLPESIDGSETITIDLDSDKNFVNSYRKPENLRVFIENSMYQVISDEMLNMFAGIVSFHDMIGQGKYTYTPSYDDLTILRSHFFQKIENKPSIEKYIEFYKWLDSSLGTMLDQLKPENSAINKGLKTTIESHVFERNKVSYQRPLFVQSGRYYNGTVSTSPVVISTKTAQLHPSGTIEDICNVQNVQGTNFQNNYEVFNTTGKIDNNRTGKTSNKSVFTLRFSSADGQSGQNRDTSGEYSIYNSLNYRNSDVIADYTDGVILTVPLETSSYTSSSIDDFMKIPDAVALSRSYSNTVGGYKEPVVRFTVPAKHTIRVAGALQDIKVSSPYWASKDSISNPNLLEKELNSSITPENLNILKGYAETFTDKLPQQSGYVTVRRSEHLDVIFPRKELISTSETRTKPNFEEVAGTGSNGYDRNSGEIRLFWKSGINNRLRTRGADITSKTGSINCMNYPNYSASSGVASINRIKVSGSAYTTCSFTYENNPYNSLYSMDNQFTSELSSSIIGTYVRYSSNKFGDLAAIQTPERVKTILSQSISIVGSSSSYTSYNNRIQPSPSFVFINYPSYSYTSASDGLTASIRQNASYTSNNTDITPAYNSYVEYFANIKHKSQNYTILPEFMVSNHESIITGSTGTYVYTSSFLKILGREQFSQITSSHFVTDRLKIVDSEPTKLKIKVKGIKKLLPYNGFYPQQRAVQVVDLFQKSHFNISQSQITGAHNIDKNTNTPLDQQAQTFLQPLFAPGVLFNSIKAGIAVDFPIYATASASSYVGFKPNFYNSCSANDVDNTFYILDSSSTHRVQFETLLDPSLLLAKSESNATANDKYFYYLDPTHYSTALVSGTTVAYPVTRLDQGGRGWNVFDTTTIDSRYTNAMHNYLAEITRFFLRDGSLTKFESSPAIAINIPAVGEYKMKLTISKNSIFSMFKGYGDSDVIVPRSSLFGPPMRFWSGSIADAPYAHTSALQDPAYAAYAPPYMIGDTSTIITYNATTTGSKSLEEIVNNCSFSTSTPDIDIIFSSSAEALIGSGNYDSSPAYQRKMDLTPCMNFKQVVDVVTEVTDQNGRLVQKSTDNNNKKWVIETKFESPLIDYSDFSLSLQIFDAVTNPAGDSEVVKINNSKYGLDGIWNTKGNVPKDGESVQLKLSDVGFDKSLAKLLGFRPQTKSIGVLAETKEISEAIVLIPKTDDSQNNSIFKSNKVSEIIGQTAFDNNISEDAINKILNIDSRIVLARLKDKQERHDFLTDRLSNPNLDPADPLVRQMRLMLKYNIPPHLNWLIDYTIQPFTMFIVEFKTVLTKQDLANIWQGDLPTIGTTPEEEEQILEFPIDAEAVLKEALTQGSLEQINFDVFKVKLRGENNYYNITSGVEKNKPEVPYYSYNWPYDFFSLVELVNIEAGFVKEERAINLQAVSGSTATLTQQRLENISFVAASAFGQQ
jgi:hypothetical protein